MLDLLKAEPPERNEMTALDTALADAAAALPEGVFIQTIQQHFPLGLMVDGRDEVEWEVTICKSWAFDPEEQARHWKANGPTAAGTIAEAVQNALTQPPLHFPD